MILLASLHDAASGGLAIFDGSEVRFADRVGGSGLDVRDGKLYRVCPRRVFDGAELLVYDATGIRAYHRIDEATDPHDVLACDDGTVLCVSPFRDAVLRLHPNGTTTVLEGGERTLDARHLNCLTRRDGTLFATAFGRGETFREWKRPGKERDGILFELESGRVEVDDLVQPHSPRWVDDAWLVCDSGRGALVRSVPGGPRSSVSLGGFTRGLCVSGDTIYVGISRRGNDEADNAEIVELDRTTLVERARHTMPGEQVYDIVAVDEALAAGVERGFSNGTLRESATGQASMFATFGAAPRRLWAVGAVLPRGDRRCTLRATLPPAMTARDAVVIDVDVRNRGTAIFVGVPPARVQLTYRWERRNDDHTVDVIGAQQPTTVPHPIPPGESASVRALVVAPDDPGTYDLVLTLMHQRLEFDGDNESALRATVRVAPRDAPILKPGRRYAFGEGGDEMAAFLGWGWQAPEATGTWTTASPAQLFFRVAADGTYALALEVAGYRADDANAVIRIVLGETEALAEILPQTPATIVTRDVALRAERPIEMAVHVSRLFRPLEQGIADARTLGTHVSALTLVKTPAPS